MIAKTNSPGAAARPACNPSNPRPENAHYSFTVASDGQNVTVFTTRQACGQSMGNTYQLQIKDDETFQFYGDVSPQLMAALSGIYRTFMFFSRYGFDREP